MKLSSNNYILQSILKFNNENAKKDRVTRRHVATTTKTSSSPPHQNNTLQYFNFNFNFIHILVFILLLPHFASSNEAAATSSSIWYDARVFKRFPISHLQTRLLLFDARIFKRFPISHLQTRLLLFDTRSCC